MSVPEAPPPVPPPTPQGNSGCGTVALVIVGVILLLPGLCSLIAMANFGVGEWPVMLLWLIPFGIAAGGVGLIILAAKNS